MARGSRTSRTIRAHDTDVRLRRPALAALACLLTLGVWGAVHHQRLTRELARFGRARGRMPFPFIRVSPGASTLAWIAGLLGWYGLVAAIVAYVAQLLDGYTPSTEDITAFASIGLLLAPLWLAMSHTMRRIRTAQHLAGVDGPHPSPLRGAILAAIFPPLGSWHAQRQANRAWAAYR